MPYVPRLSTFLRASRKKKHLTQTELGRRLGYTPQFIANWESGVSKPPLKAIILLKEILEIPGRQFLEVLVKEGRRPYEDLFTNKND
jgi:transcriptional regulator with XRE-family HTH domain